MLPTDSFQPMTTAFRFPAVCAWAKVVVTVLCGVWGVALFTWTKAGVTGAGAAAKVAV
jgi:hypothetical protein